MNKTTTHKPTRSSFSLLHQLCNLIPAHLVPKLARETGVIKRSRTFTPWSHVVSLLYAQLTHAIGLNDVCDALRLHSGPLAAVRGATPPSKNALSTANRERAAQMAQDLFYAVLAHLEKLHPRFWPGSPAAFCLPFQTRDPFGGRHHHSTGRPLSGLGQTSPPQGRRQVPSPARPANLPAALRPRGQRAGALDASRGSSITGQTEGGLEKGLASLWSRRKITDRFHAGRGQETK